MAADKRLLGGVFLASKNGREYLLVFNVYGATTTLEVIRLLKEGGAKRGFLVGSLGGKELPVGTLVLPTKVVDKTGFVAADIPNKQIVEQKEGSLRKLRRVLEDLDQAYVEGMIVSVPCVLHSISHIKKFVEEDAGIIGVELETSTFFHYSQKEGFQPSLRASSKNPMGSDNCFTSFLMALATCFH